MLPLIPRLLHQLFHAGLNAGVRWCELGTCEHVDVFRKIVAQQGAGRNLAIHGAGHSAPAHQLRLAPP